MVAKELKQTEVLISDITILTWMKDHPRGQMVERLCNRSGAGDLKFKSRAVQIEPGRHRCGISLEGALLPSVVTLNFSRLCD